MFAGMTYYEIASYFIIYSFIGWCIEVIYHAVKAGKVINRGFLCGPVCPVYGFGILAVFAMTKSVLPSLTGMSEARLAGGNDLSGLLVVFLCSLILATLVELIAGWALDMAFHARWWDYSKEPYNFRGYICLRFSILWGMAGVFVVRIVQPVMENASAYQLPEKFGWPLLAVTYAVYLFDFIITVMIVAGMNKKLEDLDEVQRRMRRLSDELSEKIGTGTIQTQQRLDESRVQAALAGYEMRDELEKQRREFREEAALRKAEYEKQKKEFLEKAEDRITEAERSRAARRAEHEKQKKEFLEKAEDRITEVERSRAARRAELEKQYEALSARAEQLKSRLLTGRFAGSRRLLAAFPEMRHRHFEETIKWLREEAHRKNKQL